MVASVQRAIRVGTKHEPTLLPKRSLEYHSDTEQYGYSGEGRSTKVIQVNNKGKYLQQLQPNTFVQK
ncbi:hypothetical protein Gotri_021986 [Gossypium trilobum]|uniref:Uncharacterized protein n=1 Tax=Gossypium trilobum TaxID=34281 RepID=A0A7J9DE80_9ROSI|nr:hypothetical protein [Gossypium trilobum]